MTMEKHVLILGIGGAGARTASKIAAQGIAGIDTAIIDTDKRSFENLAGTVESIHAGSGWSWREDSGCGGDVIRGEQAVAKERSRITQLMQDRPLIVVTGGLGGGTATGGVRTLASVANAYKIPVVFLLTTPFSFESFAKRKAADECVDNLIQVADLLIRLPNDLLFSMIGSDSPVEEAFDKSCAELARSAIGIAEILSSEYTFNTDFASLMALVKGRRCSCGIGVGLATAADGANRCQEAIRRMLESPFLGGADSIKKADAVIVSICASKSLSIGDLKRSLELVTAMASPQTPVECGFNTNSFMGESVQITVITIDYEETLPDEPEEPEEDQIQKKIKSRRRRKEDESKGEGLQLQQGMFELPSFSRGIFADTVAIKFNNEDLDIPTFQRREIFIDKGTTTK